MRVAFIGLGVMGYPMAAHLQRGGHDVTVYNRTVEKAIKWSAELGGNWRSTPAEAAEGVSIAFMCVGNDDDVRSVALGDHGVIAGLPVGSLLVDHTTASAELAREISSACEQHGIGFLDAPVSGGQVGAENGTLTIMAGGEEESFQSARPVLELYSRCIRLLGPAGSGQLAKMVNQICIAGIVQGLSEGLAFARAAGLDPAAVVEVVSKGAAQSWQMDNRYRSMLDGFYEHGFAVDWMRKDLAIVRHECTRLGLELPVTELVDRFYSEIQSMGGGRWDTSSLFARMQHTDK
ncbi:MAG: NAD(P)-dependent oxidoreductase [Gammaproteobacteria bacterium]|nr:NAD(P)-dependent oxidoreductase [Gammaproteobacteria bacterium]